MNVIVRNYRLIRSIYNSSTRTFMMSSSLAKEVVETLQTNPYYEKYSQKIIEKQKLSPEEFDDLWKQHTKKQKYSTDKKQVKPLTPGEAKAQLTIPVNSNKNLDKIMKLELIKDKSADEIKQIWEDFHKTKEYTIAATVPVNTFHTIMEKSKRHPIFLLPLPRDQGYEFIMMQFAGNEIHFTPLISYQTHKENAPECLTISYYSELLEEKNVVLMRGEYDKNVINAMEAQCLANQLQLFYGENNEKRTKLMERFTFYPDEFKHMDLIAEIETISI